MKILAVDDDPSILEVLEAALSSLEGYDVYTALSATEGLEILMDHPDPFTVVLVDIQMPSMNGIEAFPHLLRASPCSRIVMASSLTRKGAAVTMAALAAGANVTRSGHQNLAQISRQHVDLRLLQAAPAAIREGLRTFVSVPHRLEPVAEIDGVLYLKTDRDAPRGRVVAVDLDRPDRAAWRAYDATALIEDGKRVAEILVDQGTGDVFLDEQLKPDLLAEACAEAGIPLELRRQPDYDHSYYFMASFIADHIVWHRRRLA